MSGVVQSHLKWIDLESYYLEQDVRSVWIESSSSADRPLEMTFNAIIKMKHVTTGQFH